MVCSHGDVIPELLASSRPDTRFRVRSSGPRARRGWSRGTAAAGRRPATSPRPTSTTAARLYPPVRGRQGAGAVRRGAAGGTSPRAVPHPRPGRRGPGAGRARRAGRAPGSALGPPGPVETRPGTRGPGVLGIGRGGGDQRRPVAVAGGVLRTSPCRSGLDVPARRRAPRRTRRWRRRSRSSLASCSRLRQLARCDSRTSPVRASPASRARPGPRGPPPARRRRRRPPRRPRPTHRPGRGACRPGPVRLDARMARAARAV